MKKGIVITKMIIIILVLAIAAYFLFNQGQFSLPTGPAPIKQTSIKSTEQASKEITSIGTGVENIDSILEDIDKTLK